MILRYFVNCSWVDTRWQQYSTHLHSNNTQNNTTKQNIQNRTYTTIRIHKNNNPKFIKIKHKRTKHTTVYTMIKKWNQKNMKECDKRKSHRSSKLHIIYISSNNGRHPVSKNFTPLHYTSPNYTSLHFTSQHLSPFHFLSFKLHPTTLHFTSQHLSPFHFLSFKLHPTTLHYISLTSHLA